MKDTKALLQQLTDLNGIAGHEYNIKKVMNDFLEPNSDEMIYDNLGGVFGKKIPKQVNVQL